MCKNPLNGAYPETVYKTGDLKTKRKRRDYIYFAQGFLKIKHMGYRIELAAKLRRLHTLQRGVSSAAAVYDKTEDSIILIYEGRQKHRRGGHGA